MGLIYMKNARFTEAVREFEKAAGHAECRAQGVNSYRADYNIGVIYECLGKKEEALAYYRKCGGYAPAEERRELQRLLRCIAGNDRDALAELYRRTRPAVYGLALSYLRNAHDAQDLTQDVYVQVWDCAAQYRPTGSPMGWLLAVCRSLCLMRLRREERRTALSDEEWDAIPAQECGLDADERVLLQHALASLGDEERRIVLLHAVTGMKHREIAALLELPLPTVLSKYHRALKKMRSCLEGDDAR